MHTQPDRFPIPWRAASLACLLSLSVCTLTSLGSASLSAAEPRELIDIILKVDSKGAGHEAAAQAVRELQQTGPETLVPLLKGMNRANPLALNWLQVSFESIAAGALAEEKLSAQELEQFVLDRTNGGRARKLAFDWLVRVDGDARGRLIPNMLDDPSGPLRREAVAQAIAAAKAAEEEAARKEAWQRALSGAVDKDQVDEISKALASLGEPVNVVEHFGLLTTWYVIGPFDNTDMQGFPVVYPPEQEINLEASYEGKEGTVKWEKYTSQREDGEFDLAELTAPHKGAIDYAYTEFVSAGDQEVEFRLATANAWKLWVNGELVFAREEYHRGMRFDQYIVRGALREGKNTILLKICQNEQTQDWAQRWAFQFRIVDETGRAVTQLD